MPSVSFMDYPASIGLIVAPTVTTFLLIPLLIARLYVRARIIHNFRIDDWLIIVASLLSVTNFVCVVIWTLNVLKIFSPDYIDKTKGRAPKPVLNKYVLFEGILMCLLATQNTIARISLVFTYRRFIPAEIGKNYRKLRLTTVVFIVLLTMYLIAMVILSIAPCWPPRLLIPRQLALDRAQLFEHSKKHHCIPPHVGFLKGSIVNLCIDTVLVIFPFLFLRNLTLGKRMKRSVHSLFAFGFIIVIVSLVQVTYYLANEKLIVQLGIAGPKSRKMVVAFTLAVLEANSIIIVTCILALRPLLWWFRETKFYQQVRGLWWRLMYSDYKEHERPNSEEIAQNWSVVANNNANKNVKVASNNHSTRNCSNSSHTSITNNSELDQEK